MPAPFIILILVLAAILVGAMMLYNSLVQMRQLLRNAWADVDVYLKRRAELIPNLVTAVKAYASHESTVLSAVTEARAQAAALHSPDATKADAESRLGGALFNVIAVAENYPDLKASSNFIQLQGELSDTERLIASARQYYNACVRDYNTKLEQFPSVLIAGAMGLKHEQFFELSDPLERAVPGVS